MRLSAGIIAALFAVIVVVTICEEGRAQTWNLDAYAGQARYSLAPFSVNSNAGVLGIRHNNDRRIFQTAFGFPLTGTDLTWGIVGFDDRLAVRRGGFLAGADISVLAHAQRDPVAQSTGRGLSAEFLPVIGQSVGAVSLEVRGGPRWHGSRFGETTWTRMIWAGDFRGGFRVAERVRLEGTVRHDRNGDKEAYTKAGFSAVAMLGQAVIHGSLGKWIDVPGDNKRELEWGASVAVPISSRIWIFTAAQREGLNPLLLSEPRTSWGAGVTFRIGGARMPPIAGPEISSEGNVVIRISVRDATSPPSIAGDFTGWNPVPMERYGNEWRHSVDLPAGVYRYAFRTADGAWFVPESIPGRTDDGMGGW
ncbi:MAG TPA: glycogen-binding domain-containing protein, partial [Acidobacteriota bacterium]|nr:glycogen-binding domain-containing protein [Acidobacteriota bacterium]